MSCYGLAGRAVPKGDWFCPECSASPCPRCKKPVQAVLSIKCGTDDKGEGVKQGCDKDFHLTCVGLKKAPKGDW